MESNNLTYHYITKYFENIGFVWKKKGLCYHDPRKNLKTSHTNDVNSPMIIYIRVQAVVR